MYVDPNIDFHECTSTLQEGLALFWNADIHYILYVIIPRSNPWVHTMYYILLYRVFSTILYYTINRVGIFVCFVIKPHIKAYTINYTCACFYAICMCVHHGGRGLVKPQPGKWLSRLPWISLTLSHHPPVSSTLILILSWLEYTHIWAPKFIALGLRRF